MENFVEALAAEVAEATEATAGIAEDDVVIAVEPVVADAGVMERKGTGSLSPSWADW